MLKKKKSVNYIDSESSELLDTDVKLLTSEMGKLAEIQNKGVDLSEKLNKQKDKVCYITEDIKNLSWKRWNLRDDILNIICNTVVIGLFVFIVVISFTLGITSSNKYNDEKKIEYAFEQYKKNNKNSFAEFEKYMSKEEDKLIAHELNMDESDVEKIWKGFKYEKYKEFNEFLIKLLMCFLVFTRLVKFCENVKYFKRFNLDLVKENETLKLYEIDFENQKSLYKEQFNKISSMDFYDNFYNKNENNQINMKDFSTNFYNKIKCDESICKFINNVNEKINFSFKEDLNYNWTENKDKKLSDFKNNLAEWNDLYTLNMKLQKIGG